MARPKKQTVDYFPHFTGSGKTKFMLENRWGNDGYAFWFKLLELLCDTDGHAYFAENPSDWEYLIAVTRVTDDAAEEILDKLAATGNIDEELWENAQIIWCQSLVDNLKMVYDKRKIEIPQKPTLRVFGTETTVNRGFGRVSDTETPQNGTSNRVSDTETTQNSDFAEVSDIRNPQSKVKYSKEKNSKVDTPSVSPPGETAEPKPTEEKKLKFGTEFNLVRLTATEHDRLIERMGRERAAEYIDRVDGYLAEGHRKKSHYVTILNWWRRDYPAEAAKSKGVTDSADFQPSRQSTGSWGNFQPSRKQG